MSARWLTVTSQGQHLALAASGAWTAEHAAELERIIDDAARRHGKVRSVDIDLARLERLDTFGAWLIERLTAHLCGARFDRTHHRPLGVRPQPH